MALRVAQHGYVMENGRVVLDGDAKTISENEDIKEFYLGLSGRRAAQELPRREALPAAQAVAVVSGPALRD